MMVQLTYRQMAAVILVVAGVVATQSRVAAQDSTLSEQESANELAALIDRRIVQGWERNKVEPAPPADDSEYLRRTFLNVVGRIPSVSEVLEFLDDTSADKRLDLVERLLDSPGYLSNFTDVWHNVIVPEAANSTNPFIRRAEIIQFETWLRDRLDRNDGFDRIAREVITGSTEIASDGNPSAFERLKDGKAENLAAGTSRAFLGVRLECAQCHNHPFAKWQREDFWKLAAFYGGTSSDITRTAGPGGRMIKIPDTEKEVQAAFIDATNPDFSKNLAPRAVLAKWVTSSDNAFFARATVNRLWGHFFGIGIVDPIDDFDERNPASHPELLDEMAAAFVAHNYDVRYLIRGMTRSRPYQLTSRRTHASQHEPRHFSRILVKGLTSDQLFNSLIWATGNVEDSMNQQGFRINNGQRERFRELFAQQVVSPGEVQTSILQALMMLNGDFVDQATSPRQSMLLSAIIAVPFFTNEQRLETLFLAALARPPRPDEAALFLKYFEGEGPIHDSKEALGDVYWALLNSSEFSLNH